MANLSVRQGEQREQLARQQGQGRGGWEPLRAMDPFRLIRDILGTDPFGGLVTPTNETFAPDVEIKETNDAYVFTVDLPGVRDADLEVSIMGNRLTVTGRREEEQRRDEDRYFVYERTYGTFSRSFVLPEGADTEHVRAALDNGVLRIEVPKKAELQARRVEVGGKEAGAKELGAKETRAEQQQPSQQQPSQQQPPQKKAA